MLPERGAEAWVTPIAGGIALLVHVQPGARKSALLGVHGGRLKISLQAPALDGRANDALLRWLAERLGTPRSRLRIVGGEHARQKRVEANGVDVAAARSRLVLETKRAD